MLRYASNGSLTAGGPKQVEGSRPDVICVLGLIRLFFVCKSVCVCAD